MTDQQTREDLQAEIDQLRERLQEYEETLRAIREGEVDALLVTGSDGDQIFTLKGAESPYRLLVEQMSEGALSLNADGLILYSNVRFAELVGQPLERVIGSAVQQFIEPADLPEYEALIRDASRAGARGEVHLRTPHGRVFPVYLSVNILPGDDSPDLCLVVTDLTGQKRNEQIVAAERLAQSILEQAAEAIVVTDAKDKILRANAAAQRLAGQNVLLRNFRDVFPFEPQEPPSKQDGGAADELTGESFLSLARRGVNIRGLQGRMRCDQTILSVIVGAGALKDAAGEFVGCVITLADISEIKRVEEQLRQTQKLESLGLLAGGVAHDFNNLLVGIMGNASLALETVSSDSPATTMLKDVVAASETAANLTKQLLAYAGKGRFVIEPVDLSDLVRRISSLIQTSIPKSVQIQLNALEGLPHIDADISQLQQLIMNLVINGAEAIEPGRSGKVLVTTTTQYLDEAYISSTIPPTQIQPGKYVILEVQDTGAGMSEATMAKIFDPFFTTKFTGRGLGLAAVLGIVRGHKGALGISSTPGQGTTFKVFFPITNVQPAPLATPQTTQLPAGETILIIDDEEMVRRTAKAMLERHGYKVVVAENGPDGLDLYRVITDRISLVLLDMTMPMMNGEEVFAELKAIKPDVKVILSSGYNEVELIRLFAGKGLTGFIQKPYRAAALAQKIQTALADA